MYSLIREITVKVVGFNLFSNPLLGLNNYQDKLLYQITFSVHTLLVFNGDL
jgi:hypothetical protein